jgi:serine phosphatase RsbU (regulator of sigma subunit)
MAVAVILDPSARSLTWASAGHPPPRWLDSGKPVGAGVPGAPIGTERHPDWTAHTECLPGAGCGVLLYTNGVARATGPHGIQFGTERISRVLRWIHGLGAAATVNEFMRTVCHFASHRLPDDASAVAARLCEDAPRVELQARRPRR